MEPTSLRVSNFFGKERRKGVFCSNTKIRKAPHGLMKSTEFQRLRGHRIRTFRIGQVQPMAAVSSSDDEDACRLHRCIAASSPTENAQQDQEFRCESTNPVPFIVSAFNIHVSIAVSNQRCKPVPFFDVWRQCIGNMPPRHSKRI